MWKPQIALSIVVMGLVAILAMSMGFEKVALPAIMGIAMISPKLIDKD